MILGAHESVAGGLHEVFPRAARDGCDAVQLWTRSSRQWAAKPLDAAAIAAFKRGHRRARGATTGAKLPLAAHASYLINLAAASALIWERSTETLYEECVRAEALGVSQVIVHPGACVGCSVEDGMARVVRALKQVCAALGAKPKVRLLLEITAGQGTCIGCSFAELGEMLQRTGERRLGVCLDTQHMWAVGIDWTTPRGYDRTFEELDRTVGLAHLEAFHLNDSKRPLGSRVDRHAVIGEGLIKARPFARLLRDERFAEIPGFLETPPLESGEDSFALGLSRLRALTRRS
ncbi:MAG: apurinic endonuclease Apn1 [Myxococcales bacterium]|nr:apurinic endonuclease Apn1 [Myxococcales bacterium]